jgi:hyperosmotically inducible periplasmic protein
MVTGLFLVVHLALPASSTVALDRASGPAFVPTGRQAPQAEDYRSRRLEFEVSHSLATLPTYGIFDHLAFELLGKGRVRLLGQVRSGVLRNQAERAALGVPGVEEIVNEIEILPPSPSDDNLRIALYRALFRDTPLERYAFNVMNPIHIIVRHGRVRLEGVVANEMDKTIAGMKAREVPFTFEVENNLRVEAR